MTQLVTVVQTENSLLVQNDDISSAKAATSRRFWGVRERAYSVLNPKDLAVAEGDTVEIYLPPGRTVASSALTFLFPLLLFPLGYVLAGRLIPGLGEGLSFLIGFGALLSGFPLSALIRRGHSAVPEILRVLTPAEAFSCRLKAEGCGSCKACG